ncbi:MAG TPA: class F sortase, partial [Thermomonospora sp.]|nr:class F sortase [Thermomonospora sp.]
ADGALEGPSETRVQQAGWYRYGAAPGSRGSAVIAGHVDSRTGPAVFYRLGELRPGDHVHVRRRDGRTAVFRITRVELVGKDRFPTRRVYGKVSYAGIRLITCGGGFDTTAGTYKQNVIAYGRLVRTM